MSLSTKQQVIDKLKNKKYFHPSKKYKLFKQEKYDSYTLQKIKSGQPNNIDNKSRALKKLDSGWKEYKPVRYIHLPENPSRHQTGLKELNNAEDFMEHFETKFEGLPNGVYTSLKGMGRGRGFKHLFLLKFKNGRVVRSSWRKKSNGTPRQNSSSYYSLPYYFRMLKKI